MTIVLVLFGLGFMLELLPFAPTWLWRLRKPSMLLGMALTMGASGYVLARHPNLFSGLLVALSLYRAVNVLRVFEERMHANYLRKAVQRTFLMLVVFQGIVGIAWWAWDAWHHTGHVVWGLVAAAQLVSSVVLLISTIRSLRHTRWPSPRKPLADGQLPTVSVLIPARNETDELQECLQSVIASDYPKLEIVVLDDCSQNRRTAEIIRGFAHDGVRFVQGETPSDTWLPKNQAYHKLAGEATGSYLLFCGADVRFDPSTIRQMVEVMRSRRKQMLSVLPRRQASATHYSLVQAMRYWWELVPPRRLFNRPPVLSSCWMISASSLEKAGGFRAVARSIVPEAYFAKRLLGDDAYSFLRGSSELGLQSVKSPADQRGTAVRTRYPQLHRKPEQVFLLVMAELAFLVMPFPLVVLGIWISIGWPAQLLATLAGILLAISYLLMARSTRINHAWFALLAMPVVAMTDIALLHYSMWRYEFSTVEWRGRNVCVPVMHVVPHLPKF